MLYDASNLYSTIIINIISRLIGAVATYLDAVRNFAIEIKGKLFVFWFCDVQ